MRTHSMLIISLFYAKSIKKEKVAEKSAALSL